MVRIRSVFATGLALLQFCAFVEAAWSEVTFSGLPAARFGHTAVWSKAADGMYIFGGRDGTSRFNGLHFFDRQAATWSEVAIPNGTAPAERNWHAAVWSEAADGMYIFGGLTVLYNIDGGFDGINRLNDLHFFDRQAATWSEVTFSGTAPTARSEHAAVWSEAADGMYIFGGYDGGRLNDLHFFDRQAATWSEVTFSGTAPTARYGHAAVWSEAANGMYVYGGYGWSEVQLGELRDLHFFDRQAATWSEVTSSGTAPIAREYFAAVWSEAANGMYVYGGDGGYDYGYMSDLHFFDPQDATYAADGPSSSPPVANQGRQEGSSASTFIITIIVRLMLL